MYISDSSFYDYILPDVLPPAKSLEDGLKTPAMIISMFLLALAIVTVFVSVIFLYQKIREDNWRQIHAAPAKEADAENDAIDDGNAAQPTTQDAEISVLNS